MAKIINNKLYTDEEYDREYHEVVLWGGYHIRIQWRYDKNRRYGILCL